MVAGGEVVQSLVEVAVFPKAQKAENFLTQLKAAIERKRTCVSADNIKRCSDFLGSIE